MVIAMLMNTDDVMTNAVVLGINQTQRFLTKDDRITFTIEKRIHTISRRSLDR